MLKYIVFLLTVFSVLNILPVSGFLSSDVKQIRREAIAPDNDFQIDRRQSNDRIDPLVIESRNIITVPPNCPKGQEWVQGQCREVWRKAAIPPKCSAYQNLVKGPCREIFMKKLLRGSRQSNPEKIKNGLPGATESRRGILKVPDLKCPIGSRLDALGNCRKRFP
uniref:Uncharacterized protein n=1 Tax=Bombyx mori TaxID=7091 RepID=A0A8R2GBE8_BOMMO|nr:uncharacterized protein LOC101742409 [Bombyx mori]